MRKFVIGLMVFSFAGFAGEVFAQTATNTPANTATPVPNTPTVTKTPTSGGGGPGTHTTYLKMDNMVGPPDVTPNAVETPGKCVIYFYGGAAYYSCPGGTPKAF